MTLTSTVRRWPSGTTTVLAWDRALRPAPADMEAQLARYGLTRRTRQTGGPS